MNNRNRILVILSILVIFIAAGFSIFFYNKEHRVKENKQEVQELEKEVIKIDDFKKKLEEAEIEVEDETENTECNLIGASEGVSYKISDNEIQVYRFDFDKPDELTVANLKKAQEEGKVAIPSFNNVEIKVLYNKGLILVNFEDHPDQEKIVEIFNNL